ncbi:MAG: hypothetical protein Q9183_007303 [Haloplaca sp. 2 TL-2023]
MLLGHGADTSLRDTHGSTPLHVAVQDNHPELISMLLKAGAHVDACDDDGKTPLDYAGAHGPEEMYQLLLLHSKVAITDIRAGRPKTEDVEMVTVSPRSKGRYVPEAMSLAGAEEDIDPMVERFLK